MLMRALLVHVAHEIAGAARIRHSLRPLTTEGVRIPANLGRIVPRECGRVFGVVLAHAGTQYSRHASDRTEKPRRTESSACAEDDSFRRVGKGAFAPCPPSLFDSEVGGHAALCPPYDFTPPPSPSCQIPVSAPQTRTTCHPSP